jgi:hypothetical protein
MTSYSACCRPNRDVARIERAFARHGKNVVVWELTGNRGYIVSDSERKVAYKSVTAAVRAARQW